MVGLTSSVLDVKILFDMLVKIVIVLETNVMFDDLAHQPQLNIFIIQSFIQLVNFSLFQYL